jgi:hypothetical protein
MVRFSSWLARGRGGVAYETCARGLRSRVRSRAPGLQMLFLRQACAPLYGAIATYL